MTNEGTDGMTIAMGPPGPFMAGVLAGIKAIDALDVPGETTLEQQAAFFWLHVGTSMASADLVDAEAQAQFVEGAKTRAPSRESETKSSDEPNWWEVSYRIGEEKYAVEVIADNEEEALYHAPLSVNRTDAVDFRSVGPVSATDDPDDRPAARDYSFLSDAKERQWLTDVSPSDVLANAHRIYDFMRDAGLTAESDIRELAFTKASEELCIDYDVLYNAWLNQKPAGDAETRAPSREREAKTSDEPNWWVVSCRIGQDTYTVEVMADNEEEALYHAPLSINRADAVDFRSMGPFTMAGAKSFRVLSWAPEDDQEGAESAEQRASDKIPAIRIWLHRAEGLHEECTEHTFRAPDVWKQARHQLFTWSRTAPDDGTIDKTDFKVTYANGDEYSGTFGLKRDDVNLPAHMRRHLQHLLAHPEVYAKHVDEARKFLDTCEIGPTA